MSMYIYWVIVFIFFIGILNRIIFICCIFFWEGKEIGSKVFFIVWGFVCRKKNYGGLDVRDVKKWNIV